MPPKRVKKASPANPLFLISVADIITGMSAACGIAAIYVLFAYTPDITLGTGLIVVSIILDGMDGAAARKWGTKHDYGHVLDSIADAIAFCLAPGVLVFVVYYNGDPLTMQGGIAIMAGFLVAFLGITRLYRYTVEGHLYKGFTGLPTPAAAFTLCLTSHIMGSDHWQTGLLLVLVAAYSMVTPLPYPKLAGKPGIAFIVVLVIATSYIMGYRAMTDEVDRDVFDGLSLFGLMAVYTYIVGGPVFQALVDRLESSKGGTTSG